MSWMLDSLSTKHLQACVVERVVRRTRRRLRVGKCIVRAELGWMDRESSVDRWSGGGGGGSDELKGYG